MKYFQYLSPEIISDIFFKAPNSFYKSCDREKLSYGLGATLYMPGFRDTISKGIIEKKIKNLISIVLCLEDSIGDNNIKCGENNLILQINNVYNEIKNMTIDICEVPLIFIRVRSSDQMIALIDKLEMGIALISGFVIPKFSIETGCKYLETIKDINKKQNLKLYCMPILETYECINIEKRVRALLEIKNLLDAYRELILNIRIGGTDFSGLFGLRRSVNTNIYELSVLKDAIAHIMNVFGRATDDCVISGPVFEYFGNKTSEYPKDEVVNSLVREALLDKENGFIGKTVIHPNQILPVQSIQVVLFEEYSDAIKILNNNSGDGVIRSDCGNKMNEIKPHLNWAKKIIKKSEIYGVYNEQKSYMDLLQRG